MPVGLFVYCIVISGSGAKVICSLASGARHAVGSAPCWRGQALARRVERRPQLARAGLHAAVAAVAQVVGARDLLAQQRAQVLPHVLVPAAVLAAGRLVEARVAPLELLAQRGAEAVAQPGVAEALPRGVEDRHAGVVDLAVAIGVAAAAAGVVPGLQQVGDLLGRARSAPCRGRASS